MRQASQTLNLHPPPPHPLRAAPVNDAPIASATPASKTVDEDQPAVFTAANLKGGAADVDNTADQLSVGAVTVAPASGVAVKDADSGSITYTPNLNWFGSDSFKYTVTDGNASVELTATVIVGECRRAGGHRAAHAPTVCATPCPLP